MMLDDEQCPVCGAWAVWTDGTWVWCAICEWQARVVTLARRLRVLIGQYSR